MIATPNPTTCWTPPQVARRWGVKPERVLSLIRAGRLRAFVLPVVTHRPGAQSRPRFRITPEAVADFESACAVGGTHAHKARRTPRPAVHFE